MRALYRIPLLVLFTTYLAAAPLGSAQTSSGLPSVRQLRSSKNADAVNSNSPDNSTSSTIWKLLDLAQFSSLADSEIFHFELPGISYRGDTSELHRRLEEKEVLIQEEGIQESFNPDDLVVSVTFSEICKSPEHRKGRLRNFNFGNCAHFTRIFFHFYRQGHYFHCNRLVTRQPLGVCWTT